MEAVYMSSLQCCSWIDSEKIGRKPTLILRLSQKYEERAPQILSSRNLRWNASNRPRHVALEFSCSYDNPSASRLESENVHTSFREALVLKMKSQEVAPYLNARCIYLVGMMGSGKTTVGKIMSEELDYSFVDSDKLVEQAVGATSVAQIFKEHSESFFRDNETEELRKLSLRRRLIVATGGGAVIRPINWKYMKHGITVWLDVPLEDLATRIASVGTNSRPLLHHDSGDAYTKALKRLSELSVERGEAYTNADARVSLQYIAGKLSNGDVSDLTPTDIAIEALEQIDNFLKSGNDRAIASS